MKKLVTLFAIVISTGILFAQKNELGFETGANFYRHAIYEEPTNFMKAKNKIKPGYQIGINYQLNLGKYTAITFGFYKATKEYELQFDPWTTYGHINSIAVPVSFKINLSKRRLQPFIQIGLSLAWVTKGYKAYNYSYANKQYYYPTSFILDPWLGIGIDYKISKSFKAGFTISGYAPIGYNDVTDFPLDNLYESRYSYLHTVAFNFSLRYLFKQKKSLNN